MTPPIESAPIDGVSVVQLRKFADERGWFCELRRESWYARALGRPAVAADEHLVLASRRDPRTALAPPRSGRPLLLPAGARARRAARPPRGVADARASPGRSTSTRTTAWRCTSRARSPTASRPSPTRVLLPRHRGVRPGRSRRAERALGRRARARALVDDEPDPLSARRLTRVLVTGGGGQLAAEFALLLGADAVAPVARRARRRRRRRRSSARSPSTRPTLVAALRRLDGRRRRRERSRGRLGRSTRRARATSRAPRAPPAPARARTRPTTSSRGRADGYVESVAGRAAHRLRRLQARRRGRGARRAPGRPRRAHRLGVRAARQELRPDDAAPRRRARRAAGRRRPARLPDLHPPSRARDARARRALPARHLPPGRRRLDELVRLRQRDHGGRRPGRPRRADPVERARAARTATGVLDPAHRARRRPTLPHWRDGLEACLAALAKQEGT